MKFKSKVAFVGLIALASLGCRRDDEVKFSENTAAPVPRSAHLIEPGLGIGNYRLGVVSNLEGLQADGVVVFTDSDGVIDRLYTEDPHYMLKEVNFGPKMAEELSICKVGRGVPDENFKEYFGLDCWLYHGYFLVIKDGFIKGVGVHKKGID
jgi:hypothetical protein